MFSKVLSFIRGDAADIVSAELDIKATTLEDETIDVPPEGVTVGMSEREWNINSLRHMRCSESHLLDIDDYAADPIESCDDEVIEVPPKGVTVELLTIADGEAHTITETRRVETQAERDQYWANQLRSMNLNAEVRPCNKNFRTRQDEAVRKNRQKHNKTAAASRRKNR